MNLAFAASLLFASAFLQMAEPITVWETGGLSDDTMSSLGEAADLNGAALAIVHTGTMRLMGVTRDGEDIQRPDPGFGYPMAVAAVSLGVPGVVAPEVEAALSTGAVVMSERSAALRGAVPGDVLEIESWNGEVLEVSIGALAPDSSIFWSEILLSPSVARALGLERPAGAILVGAHDLGVAALTLRSLIPADRPVRTYIPGQEVDRRDSPLPTVLVKERFGEFAFRPTGTGDLIEIEEAWVDANIVTVDLPILGRFQCHRAVAPYLRSALAQIEAERIGWLIDTDDFQAAGGCFNARLMRGSDSGLALSRHAWGIAVDINPSTNGYGEAVLLPDRIGDVFRSWGFAWGAGWTVPDGMHFEWARIPGEIQPHECSAYQLLRGDGLWMVVPRSAACPLS